jgi:hypothetical protein
VGSECSKFFGYVWELFFVFDLIFQFFWEMVKSRERDVVGKELGGER